MLSVGIGQTLCPIKKKKDNTLLTLELRPQTFASDWWNHRCLKCNSLTTLPVLSTRDQPQSPGKEHIPKGIRSHINL